LAAALPSQQKRSIENVAIICSGAASPAIEGRHRTTGFVAFGRCRRNPVNSQGWQDLSQLDDRLLEDVGISQEEALWSARKPFWRP
jgi:hypothetical protein